MAAEPMPVTPAPSPAPVEPLTRLRAGDRAVLAASDLPRADRQLLLALGLAPGRALRLRKAGSPWIVEVRGVRVGLAATVAERLLVHRTAPAPTDEPSR